MSADDVIAGLNQSIPAAEPEPQPPEPGSPFAKPSGGPHPTKANGHAEPAIIKVVAGERHLAADQGMQALVTAGVPFYQRDRKIVRIALVKAKTSDGEDIWVPGIVPVDMPLMLRALGQSAGWRRFNVRQKQYTPIDPPDPVAKQILAMVGEWPFPPLQGLIQSPTLRRDGSLLSTPGYDRQTGLVLTESFELPTIDRTRKGAEQALNLLTNLLAEFPFVDDGGVSFAVALSMLITPVVRGAMSVVPMHLVNKPLPGTGASYLVDCATMLATGDRAPVIAMAPNYEETEKRLVGAAINGFPIIPIDNVRELIAGEFFCQIVERPIMSLRKLGQSDPHRIPNTFTPFANGNNAIVADDMVRRTIRCDLDANQEHPEERGFSFNPLAAIQAGRGKYIAAALTIPLAYQAEADKPQPKTPLASFEDWCRVVREPLIWLGCGDPVESQKKMQNADPNKTDQIAVFATWKAAIGIGPERCCTTKEILEIAERENPFREALLAVAAQRFTAERKIEPHALGKWLASHEGTIAAGCKLTVDRETNKDRPKWYLNFLEKDAQS